MKTLVRSMLFLVTLLFVGGSCGTAFAVDAPKIVQKDGRYALMVNGRPYLILGAQINNSSSWPSTLPKVWPAIADMHANTVEAPVYWEQIEPKPGTYDFTNVDDLVHQAREHQVHLVLLWFGTWKNGQMHYVPTWVKTNTTQYPRMINSQGEPIDVLSANSTANMDADKDAFVSLTRHLQSIDGEQHTILLIQVENESGAIGTVRDHSAMANQQFAQQVPVKLVEGLHKKSGTWSQVFGPDADETFQAWYQARYINTIVKAGKAEFNIPMYVNVWVSYPAAELPERRVTFPGINYPSGGPVQKMIDLWKIAAPAINMIGPDIYSDDSGFYRELIQTYARPDNPLWIPETGSGDSFAKFFFYALGHGAIGFSPFGVDYTGWTFSGDKGPKAHTENYSLIAPMDREVALLNFEGKLKTAVEEPGHAQQELDFGDWQATVSFGFPQQDGRRPPGTPDFHGRALVAQLGPNEFLVTGIDASISFHLPTRLPGQRMNILQAVQGNYVNGTWQPLRIWNGDQTDRGLNFKHHGEIVHVSLAKF